MIKFSGILSLFFVGFVAADRAAAAVNTTTSIADAFVAASSPNNNFGGAGGLAAAAVGLPNDEFESVLRFDTSTAKAQFDAAFGAGQWHVTDVDLQLTVTGRFKCSQSRSNQNRPGLMPILYLIAYSTSSFLGFWFRCAV